MRPTSPPATLEHADKPVIWTVSVSRLSALLRDITPEYDALASIEPIDLGFDDAVRHIRGRLEHQRCDAIIAAGSNGAYLKGRLALPVIIAKASGYDMLQALARARRLSERVAVVSYQNDLPELADFAATFACPILQRTYVTAEDARAQIAELKAAGVGAVVGAGLVADLTQEAGLHAVLVYSAASIRAAFDAALEQARQAQAEARRSRRTGGADTTPRARHGLQDLRGDSQAMEALRASVALFARSPATVLIEGETGSGKELVAQALHRASPRGGGAAAARPFVAVNCGALAESLLESELFGHEDGAFTGARRGGHAGLFEAAHGGTLFLDEIGEMALPLQTRLLRVLEEREVVRVGGTRPVAVDVRVVSATHCDLAARVREGRFRADLFYRLAVLRLQLAPLRARQGDIVALAEWQLKHALAALGARAQANLAAELRSCAALLEGYAWPGNARELRNVMERLALFLADQPLRAMTPALLLAVAPELAPGLALGGPAASVIAPGSVALAMPQPPGMPPPLPLVEPTRQTLARFGGKRDLAAAYLGISRTTLWRKLRAEEQA